MRLSNAEFQALIDDPSKSISGNIQWQGDEDHSPSVEFRSEIESEAGWPLFVHGSYNPLVPALSYALILKSVGRIYALDLGKDHKNPDGMRVGEKHKHRWTEMYRDKQAYSPEDITASVNEPLEVWAQFCAEARIKHTGRMQPTPAYQEDLF